MSRHCPGRPPRVGTFITSVVLSLAMVAPAAVRAEDPREPAPPPGDQGGDQRARRLTEEGLRQFANHRYDRAVEAFEASYDIVPLPGLLYDLAQAHRLKGDCKVAHSFYTRFLASAPPEKIRKRAEARLAEMEACSGQPEAGKDLEPQQRDDTAPERDDVVKTNAGPAPSSPAPAPLAKMDSPAARRAPEVAATSLASPAPAPAHGAPSTWRLVGWTVGAAGAITGLTGLVVALLGQATMNSARAQADRANATEDARLYADAATKFSDGSAKRGTGRLLLAVGGVAMVGGLTMVLFAPQSGAGMVVGHFAPWIAGNDHQVRSNGLVFAARW